MKRVIGAVLITWCAAALGWAADSGLAKGGASYLDFAFGARAIGMGHAQAAVLTEDASTVHANSALMALQSSHAATFTTGSIGLDRSLYFAGYVFPFHSRKQEDDWGRGDLMGTTLTPSEQRAVHRPSDSAEGATDILGKDDWDQGAEEIAPRRQWKSALVNVNRTDMALGVGMTYLGVTGIEGRSEFGAREADFQDGERAIYLEYSARPYDNLSIGFGGKYLGQKLQSASAQGFGLDLGAWYGVPYVSRGHLSLALVGRDLGGNLKWTVPDPVLDTEFSYHEKVLSKWILGGAYTTPGEKWLLAADLWKEAEQAPRIYSGIE